MSEHDAKSPVVAHEEGGIMSYEGQQIVAPSIGKSYPSTPKELDSEDASKQSRSSTPSPFDLGHGGVGQTARKLKSRHIQMIGIGGGIGTGLFVGAGYALANAGPVGVLLAFTLVGSVLVPVMEGLCEMAACLPVSGSFMHFATRFIDPSVGYTLGLNYFYCYAIGIASELSAASSVIQYWNQDISIAVWITIMWVLIAALNLVGVNFYGESEVITSMVKILAFLGLILFGIIIDLGGGPHHDRLGFRYWNDPGPFAQYAGIAGAKGRFLAFFSAIPNAAFTYIGVETVVLAAGEASNPSKQIPKASKRVLYRICVFYILSILIMGMIVPYNEPRLKSDGLYSAASPWVIAIDRAGVAVLPHIINAVILISAFSAGSSYVYVASRSLYAMALEKQVPKVFAIVDKRGVPYPAVLFSLSFGAFSYLGVSSGGGTAFLWLSSLSTVAGLFAWATVSWAYLRFRKATIVQGYDRSALPYRARLQPYTSWFAIVALAIIIVFSGWSTFLNGNFTATSFLTSYLGIPLFFVPWIGYKLWYKTKMVRIEDIDLDSGRLDPKDEVEEPTPTNAWGRFLAWVF
ncbi:uncharacterized protein PFL1_06576 [Pseudozyma flocculosa PF-1]|uniref:Amino acid permease/ SLC12A domain-containing protein n=2 Tax=Pseudozyma flocculosa TaxID=84751 RepID=A0A061H112_9BASI|nr:uncharacterized protein PFL1_06576 [Pseudozyma flocculosa PF-1]EPQ25903.1 hypothetical protein PFL1_06576 [Pseudozyma flocculosa PF-1]SPO40596.1 probable general amino acid permease [Pseudozyma flocculosa]